MQSLVLVSTGGSIALEDTVIGFSPVLKTPQNKRATSPTARFFYVLNLKMGRSFGAFMVLGWSVRTVRPHAQLVLCFQLPSTCYV